eukprot:gnl/MRDRNA2_/MRDRNA2_125169_c0_seq1.p1 gnl/MRDRNA2_/MRDRNA2_125169_c0~~gnl/MRDRNA2_/MRDRNA2_125169_c0_seq1.p1  ORF type:complete len:903 (-),score=184.82 gnl/MRDRNA2_/MRDRNA2_125169_c0_seq1:83-2791(-)
MVAGPRGYGGMSSQIVGRPPVLYYVENDCFSPRSDSREHINFSDSHEALMAEGMAFRSELINEMTYLRSRCQQMRTALIDAEDEIAAAREGLSMSPVPPPDAVEAAQELLRCVASVVYPVRQKIVPLIPVEDMTPQQAVVFQFMHDLQPISDYPNQTMDNSSPNPSVEMHQPEASPIPGTWCDTLPQLQDPGTKGVTGAYPASPQSSPQLDCRETRPIFLQNQEADAACARADDGLMYRQRAWNNDVASGVPMRGVDSRQQPHHLSFKSNLQDPNQHQQGLLQHSRLQNQMHSSSFADDHTALTIPNGVLESQIPADFDQSFVASRGSDGPSWTPQDTESTVNYLQNQLKSLQNQLKGQMQSIASGKPENGTHDRVGANFAKHLQQDGVRPRVPKSLQNQFQISSKDLLSMPDSGSTLSMQPNQALTMTMIHPSEHQSINIDKINDTRIDENLDNLLQHNAKLLQSNAEQLQAHWMLWHRLEALGKIEVEKALHGHEDDDNDDDEKNTVDQPGSQPDSVCQAPIDGLAPENADTIKNPDEEDGSPAAQKDEVTDDKSCAKAKAKTRKLLRNPKSSSEFASGQDPMTVETTPSQMQSRLSEKSGKKKIFSAHSSTADSVGTDSAAVSSIPVVKQHLSDPRDSSPEIQVQGEKQVISAAPTVHQNSEETTKKRSSSGWKGDDEDDEDTHSQQVTRIRNHVEITVPGSPISHADGRPLADPKIHLIPSHAPSRPVSPRPKRTPIRSVPPPPKRASPRAKVEKESPRDEAKSDGNHQEHPESQSPAGKKTTAIKKEGSIKEEGSSAASASDAESAGPKADSTKSKTMKSGDAAVEAGDATPGTASPRPARQRLGKVPSKPPEDKPDGEEGAPASGKTESAEVTKGEKPSRFAAARAKRAAKEAAPK